MDGANNTAGNNSNTTGIVWQEWQSSSTTTCSGTPLVSDATTAPTYCTSIGAGYSVQGLCYLGTGSFALFNNTNCSAPAVTVGPASSSSSCFALGVSYVARATCPATGPPTPPPLLNVCADHNAYLPNALVSSTATCAEEVASLLSPYVSTGVALAPCDATPIPSDPSVTVREIIDYLAITVGCCGASTAGPAPCLEIYPCPFLVNTSYNPCAVGGYNTHSITQPESYWAAVCDYCYNQTNTSTWDPACSSVVASCVNFTGGAPGTLTTPVSTVASCPFDAASAGAAYWPCGQCSYDTVGVSQSCLQIACGYCVNTVLQGGASGAADAALCSQTLLSQGFCDMFPRVRPSREEIVARVQPVLDQLALQLNTTLSFG
jgi:hypothetical protein